MRDAARARAHHAVDTYRHESSRTNINVDGKGMYTLGLTSLVNSPIDVAAVDRPNAVQLSSHFSNYTWAITVTSAVTLTSVCNEPMQCHARRSD